MSDAGASHVRNSSDCVHCQRMTAGADESQRVDIRALYNRIKAGSWSVDDDQCWKLLTIALTPAGFTGDTTQSLTRVRPERVREFGTEVCPILPSRVSIVLLSALELSLSGWPAWRSAGTGLQIFDDGVYASRVFALLRFVLWISTSSENRRVILHHRILACIRETLATIRECRTDVFGEDMLELLDPEHDSEFVPDIRFFDWISATQASADAYMVPGEAYQAEPSTKTAGCILFQLLMLLCVRLLDPEAKFAEHLKSAHAVGPESEFTMVDANEGAKGLLAELLLAWQRLEVVPSRPRFSQVVLSLSCAIGGVLVSGWVDSHQLHQLNIAEAVARPMHWFQSDEAYLAWRLLILLAEQHAEFSAWGRIVQVRVLAFWQTCILDQTEYLQSYSPPYHKPPVEQEAAISAEDRSCLDTIFAERHTEPLDGDYLSMQRSIHIHSRGGFIDSAVEPAVLQKYARSFDGGIANDTRLRRSFDTIAAYLALHGDQLPLPAYIRSSLATINQLLEITAARGPGADQYSFLFAEYVQFLWSVWQLPLCHDVTGAVFSSISATVWDSMLSHLAMQPSDESLSTIGLEQCTDRVSDAVCQRVLMVVGWLLMHSSPSNSAGGRSMLLPSVCKLVFHKVMVILVRVGDVSSTYNSSLTSDNSHGLESLVLDDVASLPAYRASQCVLLICWHDIRRFRLLLHETQSMEYILSALYRLERVGRLRKGAQVAGYITQSLDNLSVVSLPDESVWNLEESRNLAHRPRLVAERLLNATLFLLLASTAESCSACHVDADGSTNVQRSDDSPLESSKKSQAQVFRVIWQTCHAPVRIHPSSIGAIDCVSAISDMASSGNPAVSLVSKALVTTAIRWLLSSEFGNSTGQGDLGVDRHQLASATEQWLALAVRWVLPTDISHTSAVKQHAQFLANLRASLARAAFESQGQGHLRSIQARLVQCGILEDLLSSIQLAATIDLSYSPSANSPFSSFAGDQTSISHSPGYELGVLVGESLRLLAFVVYDSPEHTTMLVGLGGYRTVSSCLSRISANATAASAPIADSVLVLLSGLPGPANSRAMDALRVEHRWIPTMSALYPCLDLSERIAVLRYVAQWSESSSHARWHWSQSTLPRQSIELLQSLLCELSNAEMEKSQRHTCVSAYVKSLGRMLTAVMGVSMSVPDLKLIFRTLVSGPGDPEGADVTLSSAEIGEYVLLVRQMLAMVLTRCARHEANGSYFSFGGRPAALYAPYFRRIPERGFAFATWIRPDDAQTCSAQHHFLAAQLCGGGWSLPNTQPASPDRPTNTPPCVPGSEYEVEQTFQTILHISAARGNDLVVLHSSTQRGLEIRLTVSGAKHVIKCADGLVAPRQWHSLVVNYAPAKRGWSPFGFSNFHVYVNSTLVYKGALPFIEHSAYRACYIGGSPVVAIAEASSASHSRRSATINPRSDIDRAFSGLISNVRMFDGALRAGEVEVLHHLGPMLAIQFRKSQSSDPALSTTPLSQAHGAPAAASHSESIVEDVAGVFRNGDLSSRLILCLDPSARRGDACLDLSPIGICQSIVRENLRYSKEMPVVAAQSSGAISLGPPNEPMGTWDGVETRHRLETAAEPWQIIGDVELVSTLTIHHALHLLGGIEATLVLFYNLDWVGSAMPPAKEGPLGSEESAFDQRNLDRAPLPSLLYWIRDLVRGDPRHLARLRTLNLVPLIAHILERLPRESDGYITMAALRAAQALQNVLDEQGGLLPAAYAETSQFWSQVQRGLLLNFKIWRKADLATQLLYLKEVHRILCAGRRGDERGKRTNALSGISESIAGEVTVGVRWILYALFNFYPYDSSQHLSQQQPPQRSRLTHRPSSTRTSVLISEASAYGPGPIGSTSPSPAITSDCASISNESIVAASDDGYGLDDDESGDSPESGIAETTSLPFIETHRLRRVLLHTLELFLSASEDKGAHSTRGTSVPSASKADVGHLTRHLLYACNRDTQHTLEILQLLFRCLADGSSNASQLAAKLQSQHGLDVLCHIVECDDDKMAAEAINIIVLLLTMSMAIREHESAASRITNSLRGRTAVTIEPEDISRVLALVRAKRALTPALYRSLLSLALSDHASLLASMNVDSESGSFGRGMRTSHVRNLSLPTAGVVWPTDDSIAQTQVSFVSTMPARLIQVTEAWTAILELSCAPGSDPAIRVTVLDDLYKLLDEEPANFGRIRSLQTPLLDHLITACVLSGYFGDNDGEAGVSCTGESDSSGQPVHIRSLADAHSRAADHLDLVPHTTLDHRMQSLAVGHSKARRAWIELFLKRGSSDARDDDTPEGRPADSRESLENEARMEFMRPTLEWSQSAMGLVQYLAWSSFHDQPTYADDVRNSIFALWALTPTGSVPLSIRLLSLVIAHAQSQVSIALPVEAIRPDESVLAGNLAALASHVLDVLLNYRQFQEYVAYHHEQLKALSAGAPASASQALDSDRSTEYRSPHSPWDDMPVLAHSLAQFMLQLDECATSFQAPMCNLILRLVLSGIRSMHLQRVEESMSYLIMLLDRHPSLAAATGQSATQTTNHSCSGGCALSQKAFAVLGYIHEAFMFAEEQAGSAQSVAGPATISANVSQMANNSEQQTGSDEAQDNIGVLYLRVFQCYRGFLGTACSSAFVGGGDKSGQQSNLSREEQDHFGLYLQTSEWQDLYRVRCMPAMRSSEEDEMRLASASQANFANILREFLKRSHKLDSTQVRLTRRAQTAIAGIVSPIESEETGYVKKSAVHGLHRQWHWVWRRRLRMLASPRGPWRIGSRTPQLLRLSSQNWMLDMTENSQRMRRRLTRNAHYESHHLAARRRDRTGQRTGTRSHTQANKQDSFDSEEGVPRLSLSVSGLENGENDTSLDEEWNLVMPEDLGVVAAATSEPGRAHFGVAAKRILLLGSVIGRIELTPTMLRFVAERDGGRVVIGNDSDRSPDNVRSRASSSGADGRGSNGGSGNDSSTPQIIAAELDRDLAWYLSSIHQVHFRRHMLHISAIEVFFKDHSSAFFSIPNKKSLMQLVWKLTSLPGVNSGLSLSDIRSPPSLLSRLKLTERWQHGELSNFDYLMALNSVAGRSYNDLSQYPVFPWIISDYTSKWIDLHDPKVYRDLSRPIGALNEKRLRHFIERYESFEDPVGRIKKFHYGTHYSSAASVAYYLIRLEPFASVHVSLQSGKFDHADRQFHSVNDTWSSCLTGPGDVKELVPEFYYMPEFMSNHNRLDLGKRQDGTRLGDVKLPPWASTPEEFVWINRQALESEHVSANLHKWIDLIFGYKQRGPESVKAHNVFYYLTYEGAVNLDAIQDPVERASVESQIHYFGQTPTQLFTAPHPPRHSHLPAPLYTPLTSATGQVQQFVLQASNCDISFVGSPRLAVAGPQAALALQSIPWFTAHANLPAPTSASLAADTLGSDGFRRRASKEALTVVDASGRISTYQLTLFTNTDYKFQLSVEPLVEGYYALAAASPASDSQHRALADRRPVSYATIPGKPEMLVSCAHLDGTVKYSRIANDRDSSAADALQRTTLVGAMASGSHSASMTNAHASAVVGAMTSSTHMPASTTASAQQQTRSFAGLFGVGSTSSAEDSRKASSSTQSPGSTKDGMSDISAPPSVYIPLAARLLDAVNAPSCLYLSDQQTCVAISENGFYAVVGSAQGAVSVVCTECSPNGFGGGGSAVLGPDRGGVNGVAAVPALFAAGLADPMNTDIGHTSMAAYSSGDVGAGAGNSSTDGWVVNHVLHGHDAAVLDVAISDDHDIVASASADGTVILWAERSGRYLRTLVPVSPANAHPEDCIPTILNHHQRYSRIERIFISAEALVLCYSVSGSIESSDNCDRLDPVRTASQYHPDLAPVQVVGPDPTNFGADSQGMYVNSQREGSAANDEHIASIDEGACEVAALHVYGINGRHLRTRKLVRHLRDIALTRDGKYGACVSLDSRVAVFDTHTLDVVRQFELPACGCSVTWSGSSEQQLVVGCEGGQIVVISADLSLMH
ncbi:hypothetical protein GGH94_002533 [Coemansia aciculifera]|uniref:Beige protein homolog 1 n=1 Tax=Coemansia aciculifera TaxID=417176 RepID=A0A9W8INW0_9FUNG|nr:hypothetical protein GGH94_002533 [Coemansia aciculifera]